MSRIRRFCADCGKTDQALYENFCQECFWKSNSLVKVNTRSVELPYCLTCISVKLTNGWFKPVDESSLKDHIASNMTKLIQFNFVCRLDIDEVSDINWDVPKPQLQINYVITSDEIDIFDTQREEVEIEVFLTGGICTTCVKKKTGSSEVVVQFRAKNRKIDADEEMLIGKIAMEVISNFTKEVNDAYLSEITDNHGGHDLYFGNQYVAQAFIEKLKNRWIGHHEINYTLQTEDKEGKRIYSMTHLYRIPEAKIHDYIIFKDELYQTLDINKSGVRALKLRTFEKVTIRDWEALILADPPPTVVGKMIISEDYGLDTYQMMDPISYEIFDFPKDQFPYELPIGETLEFIDYQEDLYSYPRTKINGE